MDERNVSSNNKGKEPWYGNTVWPGVAALVALFVGFLNWTAQKETRRVAEDALSVSRESLRAQQRPFLEVIDVRRNGAHTLAFSLRNTGRTTAYEVVTKFSTGIGSVIFAQNALTYQERTPVKEIGILSHGWITVSQDRPVSSPEVFGSDAMASLPNLVKSIQPKSELDLVLRIQAEISYVDTHKHAYQLKWCFVESLRPGSLLWMPCPGSGVNSSN